LKKYIIISLIILLSSCNIFNKNKSDNIVARAYDKYLYDSDLTGIIPHGTTATDSISIIKNYINNWIRQKVILHKAEQNLINKQRNFTKQLENYRNSLIIYEYEKNLVSQKLDTNITEQEIINYYNNNKKNFELKDNIVRVVYVKLHLNSPDIKKVKNLYKSDKTQDREKLTKYCYKYAVNFFFDDSWLIFNDLLKEIPINTYNQENYLKNHRFIEIKDSLYYYFVNIKGFKIKESTSPLSLEKENIKNIILNKRKIRFINNMHNKIFKDALKNNDFETFF